MRNLQILAALLFIFIACEDREPAPVVIPNWLESRIAELEESACPGCNVTRYTYEEAFYYQVYCNYWSCSDCEIYHYDGVAVDWEIMDKADFMQNRTRPVLMWECSAESSGE